jgi:hypothetical protein
MDTNDRSNKCEGTLYMAGLFHNETYDLIDSMFIAAESDEDAKTDAWRRFVGRHGNLRRLAGGKGACVKLRVLNRLEARIVVRDELPGEEAA